MRLNVTLPKGCRIRVRTLSDGTTEACKATFSERQPKPLGTHTISVEKATQIISMMVEGVSLRAISRLTDTDLNTIMSLLLTVGKKCRTLFDLRVRNVRPRFTEFDEIWCFVHTKERHLNAGDPAEWGDAHTWTAIDSQTKLLISYHIGKRKAESANTFVGDYNSRVVGRHQVTSDGLRSYIDAIKTYFGADIDYAQLIKIYGKPPENSGPEWYGSGKVIDTVPTQISGNPDEAHICTSHVERSNLTIRMQLRRFTRGYQPSAVLDTLHRRSSRVSYTPRIFLSLHFSQETRNRRARGNLNVRFLIFPALLAGVTVGKISEREVPQPIVCNTISEGIPTPVLDIYFTSGSLGLG